MCFCLAAMMAISTGAAAAFAAAQLTVDPSHYDFGEVPEGPPVSLTAVLENTGDADVTIKNVWTHCACTDSELGKQTLKPREKTTLKITYNTADRPGIFKKDITIETDIVGHEEVEMEVVGTVKEAPGAKILVTPRKIDAGNLKKGSSTKLTMDVRNDGTLPLVIRKITERATGLVFYDGVKQGDILIGAGETRRLELEYKTAKSGPFTDVLIIDSNAKNAAKGGFAFMVVGKSEE